MEYSLTPEDISTLVLLGSFLVMILLRFPIAYAVGLSTVFCLISQGQALVTFPQQMVKGIWSFSLMAVPFFITMGVLMGSGGISDKLIALANSLVGWMRGGLLRRHFRFSECRYGITRFDSDSHDGRSGLRC